MHESFRIPLICLASHVFVHRGWAGSFSVAGDPQSRTALGSRSRRVHLYARGVLVALPARVALSTADAARAAMGNGLEDALALARSFPPNGGQVTSTRRFSLRSLPAPW